MTVSAWKEKDPREPDLVTAPDEVRSSYFGSGKGDKLEGSDDDSSGVEECAEDDVEEEEED
jgi:hypothetical protein